MNQVKIAVLGALGLALAAGNLAAQPAEGSGPRGPRPGMGHQGPPPEIVAQYDVNKDGKLDEQEHAAIRADIESGKLQPPAGGPRGPRGPKGPPAPQE
jgi:hypothetical protein